DVPLRIGGLGAYPVVDLLRAHVEPADVDVRMLRLEAPLHQQQQVAPMRGVDHHRGPAVAAARREGEEEREEGERLHKPVGSYPVRAPRPHPMAPSPLRGEGERIRATLPRSKNADLWALPLHEVERDRG